MVLFNTKNGFDQITVGHKYLLLLGPGNGSKTVMVMAKFDFGDMMPPDLTPSHCIEPPSMSDLSYRVVVEDKTGSRSVVRDADLQNLASCPQLP